VIALFGAVFLASLLGSTHCAGMCGAFLAFAVAGPEKARHAALHAAYNGGRLITYAVLGTAAGALGAAVDLGGSAAGIQRLAAALAGATMVILGAVAVLRLVGWRIPRAPVPAPLQRLAVAGHRAALAWHPVARAAAIGLLTTLLPCGWLYAFVVTAAGTASPAIGALAMIAFWLGTLPMMIGLGAGLRTLSGPLRKRLPMLTSLLLVAVGLGTLVGRAGKTLTTVSPPNRVSIQEVTERVRTLDATEAPCCHDR
jgi:sulfite exporter TauE/SafE